MFGDIEPGKIHIFYGKMGSGKTTNAMRNVLAFHKKDHPVWVNFPVLQSAGVNPDGAPIWFEDNPEGILDMRGGLYVIDEAYLTLNSREWASLSKKVFTAFTHVRKLGMTVIIIAQSWMRIDKSIREVSTRAREFRGSSFLGRVYPFTEYEVDELGEIIKHEPLEYRTALRGFSLVRKRVYDAFDTDYLFADRPSTKKWQSAIDWKPGAERPATGFADLQPAPLAPANGGPGTELREEGTEGPGTPSPPSRGARLFGRGSAERATRPRPPMAP